MQTFTGLIAEKQIVGGHIEGNDLILERFDESTINAGDVRGPMGEVSEEQLASSLSGLVETDTYTPDLTNVNIGTGGNVLNTARYTFVGGTEVGDTGIMYIYGALTLGTSGASISGAPNVGYPAGFERLPSLFANANMVASARLIDAEGGSTNHLGVLFPATTSMLVAYLVTSGSTLIAANISSSAPFTWAANDRMTYEITFQAKRV